METVGSMFAGVGGICLAFVDCGANVIWANELDSGACSTYRANFNSKILVQGDIRQVRHIPAFDILTAGFPCQAFSIAGAQNGFADERGNLFFEVRRVLASVKPKAFLLENVKNLTRHDGGRTFQVIQDTLISEGYHIKHQVLNTMEHGNIPQNRERIFIVGFLDSAACNRFHFPPPIPLTKTIHDIIDLSDRKDDFYYYTQKSQYYPLLKESITRQDTLYQLRRIYVRENKSNVCPTLTANMGTGGHNVPLLLDHYGIRKLTPRECFAFQGFPDSYILPDGVSNTNLYKQAGNTVSVPVVKLIAKNMLCI